MTLLLNTCHVSSLFSATSYVDETNLNAFPLMHCSETVLGRKSESDTVCVVWCVNSLDVQYCPWGFILNQTFFFVWLKFRNVTLIWYRFEQKQRRSLSERYFWWCVSSQLKQYLKKKMIKIRIFRIKFCSVPSRIKAMEFSILQSI